tara:strand:- start:280 stop:552 length:273 start_codon:yes stop_codon:yes gene_type:complete
MTALSEETIAKLAEALVPEVIAYIEDDFPRLNEFLMEVIGDAVCNKLGNKNPDGSCTFDSEISMDLVVAIAERISIRPTNNLMESDPANL